jgi:hypothetical protein
MHRAKIEAGTELVVFSPEEEVVRTEAAMERYFVAMQQER